MSPAIVKLLTAERERIAAQIANMQAEINAKHQELAEIEAALGVPITKPEPAPAPTMERRRRRSPRFERPKMLMRGGERRPQRLRRGTNLVEMLFKSNAYCAAADRLGIGADNDGREVWITVAEWDTIRKAGGGK